MTIVRQLLQNKGQNVWSVKPDDVARTALQLMAEKNIGAVPVLQADQLVGIFSERDYARKVILQGLVDLETPISKFMTGHVITVTPEQTIEDCMSLMTEKHIRHLPVIEDRRLIGLISIGDVVKELITDRELMIQHLENYITGRK
jgi:CBS domain-containing protein